MTKTVPRATIGGLLAHLAMHVAGCAGPRPDAMIDVQESIRNYEARSAPREQRAQSPAIHTGEMSSPEATPVYFGEMPPTTNPTEPAGTRPSAIGASEKSAGYWRPNLGRQMGGELKQFVTHDGWHAFKDAYWRVDNALVLAGTLGASIAIRESGVDDAIRRRTVGEFKMGDLDESVQILGHPGTHFAAAGLLWAGSAATQDMKTHEFSRALGEALIVNGVTTMALKVGTNTRAPDTDNRAWPSGHTSSAFTTAAVVNEFYGPWAGVPSLALAGLVGYQRIDSRVHDFSDVVFGAVLGYVVGSSIAREQKGDFPELWGMKVLPYTDPQTGATGLALFKSW